jgi:curved DNA-binding protein CbpA
MRMPRIKTFYDELGVTRDANAAAIKHAFKEIAKVYHPDKNPPEKQAWAHEQMSRLNFIVETLLNPATRQEYDELVKKYESIPLIARPRRTPHEQDAIEREYAQVSVEIMNLAGKYSNCRLKMTIGGIVGGISATAHLAAYFTPLGDILENYPMTFAFTYFIALIGGIMMIFGLSDYLGRGEYRRRIDELEQRRAFLRRRMFEAYVGY